MQFFIIFCLQSVCALRIDISKFTGKNIIQNDNNIESDTKQDDQTKNTLTSLDDLQDMLQRNNETEKNENVKREISVNNFKQLCSESDYDIEDFEFSKNHRCISINNRRPLRIESKIFSRSIQDPEAYNLEHSQPLGVIDEVKAANNEHDDDIKAIGESKLFSSIIPRYINTITDDDTTELRREINKTNQDFYDIQFNPVVDDSDSRKHRAISINHKFSPRLQNTIFARNSQDSKSQVFSTEDDFKEVQFTMNEF